MRLLADIGASLRSLGAYRSLVYLGRVVVSSIVIPIALLFTSGSAIAHAMPSPTVVSFDLFRGKILFTVRAGGRDLHAIYDTGAEVSVLSETAAGRLRLALSGANRVGGFGGGASMRLAHDVNVEIGGMPFNFAQIPVINLSTAAALFGRPVDIVIGRDVFHDEVVTVDFAAAHLSWTPHSEFSPPDGAFPEVLRRRGAILALPVVVDGHAVEAGLDLGAREAVTVSDAFAQTLGLNMSEPSTTWAYGVGGPLEQRMSNITELVIGSAGLRDAPVAVAPGPLPTDVDVIFGLPVWSRFKLALDFERQQAWIAPLPSRLTAPFERDLAGLTLSRSAPDRLRVERIGAHSPSIEAGLKVGDEINAVDGVSIEHWPLQGDLYAWASPEGRVVHLHLLTGETRTLTLRRFY